MFLVIPEQIQNSFEIFEGQSPWPCHRGHATWAMPPVPCHRGHAYVAMPHPLRSSDHSLVPNTAASTLTTGLPYDGDVAEFVENICDSGFLVVGAWTCENPANSELSPPCQIRFYRFVHFSFRVLYTL